MNLEFIERNLQSSDAVMFLIQIISQTYERRINLRDFSSIHHFFHSVGLISNYKGKNIFWPLEPPLDDKGVFDPEKLTERGRARARDGERWRKFLYKLINSDYHNEYFNFIDLRDISSIPDSPELRIEKKIIYSSTDSSARPPALSGRYSFHSCSTGMPLNMKIDGESSLKFFKCGDENSTIDLQISGSSIFEYHESKASTLRLSTDYGSANDSRINLNNIDIIDTLYVSGKSQLSVEIDSSRINNVRTSVES